MSGNPWALLAPESSDESDGGDTTIPMYVPPPERKEKFKSNAFRYVRHRLAHIQPTEQVTVFDEIETGAVDGWGDPVVVQEERQKAPENFFSSFFYNSLNSPIQDLITLGKQIAGFIGDTPELCALFEIKGRQPGCHLLSFDQARAIVTSDFQKWIMEVDLGAAVIESIFYDLRLLKLVDEDSMDEDPMLHLKTLIAECDRRRLQLSAIRTLFNGEEDPEKLYRAICHELEHDTELGRGLFETEEDMETFLNTLLSQIIAQDVPDFYPSPSPKSRKKKKKKKRKVLCGYGNVRVCPKMQAMFDKLDAAEAERKRIQAQKQRKRDKRSNKYGRRNSRSKRGPKKGVKHTHSSHSTNTNVDTQVSHSLTSEDFPVLQSPAAETKKVVSTHADRRPSWSNIMQQAEKKHTKTTAATVTLSISKRRSTVSKAHVIDHARIGYDSGCYGDAWDDEPYEYFGESGYIHED